MEGRPQEEGRKGCPERRESAMNKWHRHAPERQTGPLGSGGCEDFQGRQGFLKFVTQKTLSGGKMAQSPSPYDGVHQLPKVVL